MRRKIRAQLTTNRVMVVVIAVLFALAWAVPSIGASAGKVARVALARSNQAVHDSNVAVATSNTAKSTASTANNTSNVANTTANAANTTANSAKTTANQALSLANGAAQVFANATKVISPGSIGAGTCVSFPFSQALVAATDEVIVTPPSNLDLGIIVQGATSAGSVTLTLCNITNSGIDPGTDSYEYSVIR
jgi:hypothetical protein